MRFEALTADEALWAVVYDGEEQNAFDLTFDKWFDAKWLRDFFEEHLNDLKSFFKITDIDRAIFDTLSEANSLQCLILDMRTSLEDLFRPLEPYRTAEMTLGREKAKGRSRTHASWLRLYAVKLQPNRYIITGGAIKLTATMQEREHTLEELKKLNKVRDHLLSDGVIDYDGFKTMINDQTD